MFLVMSVCVSLFLCVCVSVCLSVCLYVFLSVQAITFELLDIETSFLLSRYILTISRSLGQGQGHMERNDSLTYFNLLILCMWLQVINKVKLTHQGEGHIKVKVKYLHSFKFYVARTLCKRMEITHKNSNGTEIFCAQHMLKTSYPLVEMCSNCVIWHLLYLSIVLGCWLLSEFVEIVK